MRLFAALLLFFGFSTGATAAQPSTPFEQRAAQLPDLLNGTIPPESFFAASFLNEVPSDQVRQVAAQLTQQHGTLRRTEGLRAETDINGEIDLGYDRATVTVQLVTSKFAPHFVVGLLVTGARIRDDSLSKLTAEFAALPGKAGFLIARRDQTGRHKVLAAHHPETSLAIGSTFKLWVLAEAAAQVKAGTRRWSDIVLLGPPSLPSGVTQDWPSGSPMTVHSLATLMISISDNSATDTLMTSLGRDAVDNRYKALTQSEAPNALPIVSTLEAFVLKMPAMAKQREIWTSGGLQARRAMLRTLRPRLSMIDRAVFGDRPAYIESIEWFASPTEIANALFDIRDMKSKEAMGILSINRPLPVQELSRFAYTGYKGGSEVGVMSMSFLIQTKSGEWFTVTGTWNNPAAAVDERRFEGMMQRAVNMIN